MKKTLREDDDDDESENSSSNEEDRSRSRRIGRLLFQRVRARPICIS